MSGCNAARTTSRHARKHARNIVHKVLIDVTTQYGYEPQNKED